MLEGNWVLIKTFVLLPLIGVALILSGCEPLPAVSETGVTQSIRISEEPPEVVLSTPVENQPDNTYLKPTGEWPLGMVHSSGQGIFLIPFDYSGQIANLDIKAYTGNVLWAFPDQRGGLIFQHNRTPEPWPAGAVLWLRAGALQPELLVLPQVRWEPNTFPLAGIMPIGITHTDEGHALFVYAVPGNSNRGNSTQIMAADLDNHGASRHMAEIDKGNLNIWSWDFSWIVGRNLVGLVDYDYDARDGERCISLSLIRLDDGSPAPLPLDCLPGEPVSISHDGSTLGLIVGKTAISRNEKTLSVAVIELPSGEYMEQATIEDYGYRYVLPVSIPGGWLVYAETANDIRLIDLKGEEQLRIDRRSLGYGWNVTPSFYHHPFELAPEASINDGDLEPSCKPNVGELPSQDLPEAVAVTRQLLFELASACDYQGLAELARAHNTYVLMYRAPTIAYSVNDLARSWISEGGNTLALPGVVGFEPLGMLAALLKTTPVYVETSDAYPPTQPNAGRCVWVWPKVFIEPGDEAWEELQLFLGIDEVREMRRNAAISAGYIDYRIGIGHDGSWRFFLVGNLSDAETTSRAGRQC
jgi:hypothetical protein